MRNPTVAYDLTPYAAQNNLFFEKLKRSISDGYLSIGEIFDILPLNVIRPYNGRAILKGRGDGFFRKTRDDFVNNAGSAQVITFLDDQLREIAVTFPDKITLRVVDGPTIMVKSQGTAILVRFAVLPLHFSIAPPVHFDRFSISKGRMITTFIDASGNEIVVDGTVEEGAPKGADIAAVMAAFTGGAEGQCQSPSLPPPEDWKYAIYRNANNGYCRITNPGMEWGNVRLGIYQTKVDAETAMRRFRNDGEPPNNTNPTCEGSG